MDQNLLLLLVLTCGFALASLLGYCAHRVGLPTILGFLLAGYFIGPNSPGQFTDAKIADYLAEIGMILMLFATGMHFKLEDLLSVKKIAIPGALFQTAVATFLTVLLLKTLGWDTSQSVIVGLAIGVASTFVLARVLSDNGLLHTSQGHIAIGWLVVEDIITVIVLVLLPLFVAKDHIAGLNWAEMISALVFILAKFCVLCLLMFTIGYRVVGFILHQIAKLRSQELLTLTVIALVFLIATGSAFVFGTSLALGAFISGMVIAKTKVKHQAAANALPLKDLFTIIFFLSVGMLFEPIVIIENFAVFIRLMIIILIAKPLAALIICLCFKKSLKTSLIVALALAQIGEFSFILAEQASALHLIPEKGYDILVACSLISIALNPLLFKAIGFFQNQKRVTKYTQDSSSLPLPTRLPSDTRSKAIIVGFGPIGQEAHRILQDLIYASTIIEHNIDTVKYSNSVYPDLIFGDGSSEAVLKAAGLDEESILIIALSNIQATERVVQTARNLYPNILIVAHIQSISHSLLMEELGVRYVCSELEIFKQLKEILYNLNFNRVV